MRAISIACLALLLLAPRCGPILDADDLEAQVLAAGAGGTVRIDTTYWICRSVDALPGQTWEGEGRLVRCPVPRTRLTAPARAGDTMVEVDSTAGFVGGVGHRLGLGEGGLPDGEGACRAHWVQTITADGIEFANGLCQDYPVGTLVYAEFGMIAIQNAPGVTLRGFTIDGWEGAQPAYHTWTRANNLTIGQSDDVLIEGLTLHGAWGNGVLVLNSRDTRFIDTIFENVRCGGIHVGGTEGLSVEDSTFRRVGTRATECRHSEGAFTYSLDNLEVEIRSSCFEEILTPWGAVAHMNLNRNAFLDLEANQVCSARHLFTARLGSGPTPVDPPGGILAKGNVAATRDGLFLVPSEVDFQKQENIASSGCVCP